MIAITRLVCVKFRECGKLLWTEIPPKTEVGCLQKLFEAGNSAMM